MTRTPSEETRVPRYNSPFRNRSLFRLCHQFGNGNAVPDYFRFLSPLPSINLVIFLLFMLDLLFWRMAALCITEIAGFHPYGVPDLPGGAGPATVQLGPVYAVSCRQKNGSAGMDDYLCRPPADDHGPVRPEWLVLRPAAGAPSCL